MSRGVDPGMSVLELMNILKHSFRESEYDQVQNILMDREKEARISQKKCRQLETRVGEMEKEIEVLKRQNDELRREKIESDEKAESYKIRVEKLEPRIMKVEGALTDLLNVKVEDLAPLANSLDKTDAEGGNVDNHSDKDSEGLGNTNAIETEVERCRRSDGKGWQCKKVALPNQKYCLRHIHRKRRRAKKSQSVNNSLPHLDNGDSSTKDDGADTAQTSPGSRSDESPRRVEPQPQVPEKVNGAQAGYLIEILDTDDESNCDDKIVSDASLTNRKKRSRIYISDEEDDNIPIDGKENQDPESTHDRIPCDDDSQTHDICTDSEDGSSCSDSHMNNLVATIRSKKTGTT